MDRFTAAKAAALAMGAMFVAIPASGATETHTGQLIDIASYIMGRPADEYAGVHARACAVEGFEVGMMTADGKIYHVRGELAANNNSKLLPYILARTVTIIGDVSEKDGQFIISAKDIK